MRHWLNKVQNAYSCFEILLCSLISIHFTWFLICKNSGMNHIKYGKEWPITSGKLLKIMSYHENLGPGRIFGKQHPNSNSQVFKLFLLSEIYFCVRLKFIFVLFMCSCPLYEVRVLWIFLSVIYLPDLLFTSIQSSRRKIQNKILVLNYILIQLQWSWTKVSCLCIP